MSHIFKPGDLVRDKITGDAGHLKKSPFSDALLMLRKPYGQGLFFTTTGHRQSEQEGLTEPDLELIEPAAE